MVSVGVLAVLIKLVVLLVVSVASRLLEVIVHHFAAGHLQKFHHAPVVLDSDTWLPNIPRSIFKYRRHPAILFTLLVSVALIASDIVTELGVVVSKKCALRHTTGRVIRPGDLQGLVKPVENLASALYLQTISFLEGPVKTVRAGLPVRLSPNICHSCFGAGPTSANESNLIAAECDVRPSTVYPAGTLNVRVQTTEGSFHTVSRGFQLPNGTILDGQGDLTNNFDLCEIFTFHTNPSDKRATYLTYANQEHCKLLARRSLMAFQNARKTDSTGNGSGVIVKDGLGPVISERTHAPTRSFEVHCGTNALSTTSFLSALQVYRTMQLENTIVSPNSLDSDGTQRQRECDRKRERCWLHQRESVGDEMPEVHDLTAEDVVRAVIAIKVADDNSTLGSIYEYEPCATYRWIFAAPIACVVLSLGVLGGLATFLRRSKAHVVSGEDEGERRCRGRIDIPYNSATWFMHDAAVGRGDGLTLRSGERYVMLRDDGDAVWVEVCETGPDGQVRRVRS